MSLADLQNMFLNPDLLERYGPRFIDGLLVTGKLVAISFTLGALLGLLIALGRLSSNRFLRSFTGAYVYFFRGSPLLAQLFCSTTAWAHSRASGRTLGCGGFSAMRGSAPCWLYPQHGGLPGRDPARQHPLRGPGPA
jgi:ABC-type arginine/histidine transport system, permease component